ncbi:MAG: C25 family cysteine peptidase [bacterium]
MKVVSLFVIFALSWSGVLTVNVPVPEYDFEDGRLVVRSAAYVSAMGAPNVPSKTVAIALPPGAIVQAVNFYGAREAIGTALIPPAQPPFPLMYDDVAIDLQGRFQNARGEYYSSEDIYPQAYGTAIAKGGLRKYTLLTVACHHFAYNAVSGTVSRAPSITVEVQYTIPSPESARSQYWHGLINDITFDDMAQELVYNWDEAKAWYHTDTPQRANGYYVIIPSAIQNAVDALATHRQNQGYDVHVVTREYIETNIAGNDTQEKLRNYFRANLVDIEYALLVGFSTDMPWRNLVPFNNDPNSPWNNPDYSPIPGDLYLAELTEPDSLSWNSDGDSYYGEVFDANFQAVGEDNPDYHADIHLGRIPFSTQSVIEDICAKLISFDTNSDVQYKTSSLLTGALYYYANENNTGNVRMDGADYCEQLLVDSVLPRTTAVTLYESGGLRPCTLSCTDSLTQNNHVTYWQNKGVMYECHHGNVPLYARKLWAWDDGDSIPENPEITWPTSFHISNVYQLDNSHPSTCFLRSCLCGKPEETGLGAMLLYRGGSAVISSSRVSWASSADLNGIPYHFYSRLLQDTLVSSGIIGIAYDIARNDFMNNTGFWLPAYHYNLFGDPALRQYGQLVAVRESTIQKLNHVFNVLPNPSRDIVTVEMQSMPSSAVEFQVYDISGRLVTCLIPNEQESGSVSFDLHLPSGIYFITCIEGGITFQRKIAVVD